LFPLHPRKTTLTEGIRTQGSDYGGLSNNIQVIWNMQGHAFKIAIIMVDIPPKYFA
jgi:hypothetical protein